MIQSSTFKISLCDNMIVFRLFTCPQSQFSFFLQGKWEVPLPKVRAQGETEVLKVIKTGKRQKKAWKRMVTKVCFVGDGFTRKPPKYERFIRPMVRSQHSFVFVPFFPQRWPFSFTLFLFTIPLCRACGSKRLTSHTQSWRPPSASPSSAWRRTPPRPSTPPWASSPKEQWWRSMSVSWAWSHKEEKSSGVRKQITGLDGDIVFRQSTTITSNFEMSWFKNIYISIPLKTVAECCIDVLWKDIVTHSLLFPCR